MDPAFDLVAAVRDRSWAWLFQLGSRLSLDVHIVDLRASPVLSSPAETLPATLQDPEFSAAVGRAQRSPSVETVQIGRTLVSCAVLRLAGADSAVLALLRPVVSEEPTAQAEERRLEQIASWLRRAVEAHLESEIARSSDEAQRLTALRRALAECGAGSELDLVRVFGDAVSIWEDLEVRAYNQRLDGQYVQQWAPAGAVAQDIPVEISVPLALQTRELSHLPVQSLEQLGIASNADIISAQVAPNGSRWLLIFAGAVDPASVDRLSVYVDVLEQALKQLTTTASLQLCRSVWHHLLTSEEQPARSAAGALREIVRAVGGEFAALLVTFPHGGRALAVGDIDRFADLHAPSPPSQIAITRLLGAGGTLVMAVGRAEGGTPFTRGERDILETISEMLESWAAAIVRRPTLAGERRTAPRPFQQVVEEVAEHTIRSGGSVSVVVIRLGAAAFRPGAAHRLAAQIRSHLRAAEPAGALTEGEIAAVLFDTNPDQARAVIARLRRLGDNLEGGAALTSASMGLAYRAAGSVYDTPLILAARQDALRTEAGVEPGERIQ
ncbi:MAG TPA: hypothetical protein VG222_08955 [Vicinamibacterales bacterium]|nr:hypothetical protein [Vicinamibacterales bacterium]